MVIAPPDIINDAEFWARARRTLVGIARPLFREAFLIGAALGANTQPRTDTRRGEREATLGALIGIAAKQFAQRMAPEAALDVLFEIARADVARPPVVTLAALLRGAKDRFPGVDDNLLPIPGPDGRTLLPFDFDEITEATDQFIANYTDAWWSQIETTTRESLRATLRRAAAEGLTIPEITSQIEPLFGRARAQRIAVSETTNLMGQGAQLTYERAGFGSWIWRTVRDAAVDPICDDLARQSDPQFGGTPFPMTRRFERAHVGCRCWPVPTGKPTAPGQAAEVEPALPAAPLPAGPQDTTELHTVRGNWTPDRQRLHDQIVRDMLETAQPVLPGEQPRSYIMGGGPASGKSTVIRNGQVELPENLLRIDSDAIKLRIPEYQQMVAAGDSGAAAFAHEESSYLSKRAIKEGAASRRNVLLDGTGDASIESLTKKVEQMRGGGQRVIANYVSLDTDLAVQLSEQRAAATGRRVPLDFIRDTHRSISQILPEAIDRRLFDELYLYDTNIANTPRIVLTQVDGRIVIHDAKLWDDFVRKGGERPRFEWEAAARRRGREVARRAAEAARQAEFETARDTIRLRSNEDAIVWRKDGTRFEKTSDLRDAVNFTDEERETLRGSRMLLHNHPSSRAFSRTDLNLAHTYEIAEMQVASRKADYFLSFNPERRVTLEQFQSEVTRIERGVSEELWAKIRSGELIADQAEALHTHMLWTRMQREGYIRYRAALRDPDLQALFEQYQ